MLKTKSAPGLRQTGLEEGLLSSCTMQVTVRSAKVKSLSDISSHADPKPYLRLNNFSLSQTHPSPNKDSPEAPCESKPDPTSSEKNMNPSISENNVPERPKIFHGEQKSFRILQNPPRPTSFQKRVTVSLGVECIDGTFLDSSPTFWSTQMMRQAEHLSMSHTVQSNVSDKATGSNDDDDKHHLNNKQGTTVRLPQSSQNVNHGSHMTCKAEKQILKARISSAFQRIPSANKSNSPFSTTGTEVVMSKPISRKSARQYKKNNDLRRPFTSHIGSHTGHVSETKNRDAFSKTGQALLIVQHDNPVSLVKGKPKRVKRKGKKESLPPVSQSAPKSITFSGRPRTSVVNFSSFEPLSGLDLEILQNSSERKPRTANSKRVRFSPDAFDDVNDGMLHIKDLELQVLKTKTEMVDVATVSLPNLIRKERPSDRKSLQPLGCWNGSILEKQNPIVVPEPQTTIPPRTPIHILKLQKSAELLGDTAIGLRLKQELSKKLTILEPQVCKGKWVILESNGKKKYKQIKTELISDLYGAGTVLPALTAPFSRVLRSQSLKNLPKKKLTACNDLTVEPFQPGHISLLEELFRNLEPEMENSAIRSTEKTVVQSVSRGSEANIVRQIESKQNEIEYPNQNQTVDFIMHEAEYKMMTATPCPWKDDI